MATEKVSFKVKACLVGPEQSGKTSILNILSNSSIISSDYNPTIGAEFKVFDNGQVRFNCYAPSGGKAYRDLLGVYFKEAQFVLIVLAANDPNTLNPETLKYWMKQANDKAPATAQIHVVINKLDTIDNKQTFIDQFNAIVKEHLHLKTIHYCSAKTKEGIDRLKNRLFEAAEQLIPKPKKEAVQTSDSSRKNFSIVNFLKSFWKRFQEDFGTSDMLRNSFLVVVIGIVCIMSVGVFASSLEINLLTFLIFFSGSIITIGIVATVACGIAVFLNFDKECGYFLKNSIRSLPSEFMEWVVKHPIDFGVGSFLFLSIIVTMGITVSFPDALPVLFEVTRIIGNALGVSAAITSILIMVITITAWDVLCRIGNALCFDKGAPLEDLFQCKDIPITRTQLQVGVKNKIFSEDSENNKDNATKSLNNDGGNVVCQNR